MWVRAGVTACELGLGFVKFKGAYVPGMFGEQKAEGVVGKL